MLLSVYWRCYISSVLCLVLLIMFYIGSFGVCMCCYLVFMFCSEYYIAYTNVCVMLRKLFLLFYIYF
jgi:hypothetical protein